LQAELRARDLTVRVDGAIVWDGTLPPEIADFDGPVGLRSDNARFEFEYFVGGLAGRATVRHQRLHMVVEATGGVEEGTDRGTFPPPGT
jgi:hypothetical protein